MPIVQKIKAWWSLERAYEISYVNGIAVDTTSVPSDIVLDVKIMRDGRYMYQVDQTGLFDQSKEEHGGFGGYGNLKWSNRQFYWI